MPNQHETVVVLDFGGQYNQLIARRVRECHVYCEVKPYTTPLEEIRAMNPIGIIFTGGIGENSVLIRRLVSERLTVFGLAMDAARNQQPNSAGERLISADGSRVRCAVIPTNEERMIALDAIRLGRIHTAAALA